MFTILDNYDASYAIDKPLCVTHGGVFHADETLATAILERALGDIAVIRVSSVPDDLPGGAIVYDIGHGKFDHHQKEGAGVRKNGIPYASAGLVWKEYGMIALSNVEDVEDVWRKVDKRLVQGVDAVDCGFAPKRGVAGVMTLSQVISEFNPLPWNDVTESQGFEQAVMLMRAVLDNSILSVGCPRQMKDVVEGAIEHAEGGVMVLPEYLPWKEPFCVSSSQRVNDIVFVVYPSVRGGYNWQSVPRSMENLEVKKKAPASWRGLEGSSLQAVCNVPDAVFCHRGGFIGGAESLEGACSMAKMASLFSVSDGSG